jgi:drug/metabolite transporter (DMT)-like permease
LPDHPKSVNWLIFSLAGAACMAVTGVIDKFILDRYVHSSLAYLTFLVIFQQIFVALIPAYFGLGLVYPASLYALAAGVLQVALWASYLRALQIEETSRVAALVYVFPVFVFLGAYLFLGETLTARDYTGGALLVLSSLLISWRPRQNGRQMIFSPALKYMALFWIFAAAYALSAKYILAFMDEWHLILWSSIGSLLAVLPLLARAEIRRETIRYLFSAPSLLFSLLADEFFDLAGRGSFIFAYALGSAALVSSVSALQPFITLIYVILLGLIRPGMLEEEMDKRTLLLKLAALIMIIAGVYLIS